MLFNSFEFLAFFALCLGFYALLPHRAQNGLLLLASYLFYAAWDWRFLTLIWISTAVDYAVGLQLGRPGGPARRRRWLGLSIATNLGILGFFKYAGFFTGSLASLLAPTGWELSPFVLEVALPIGISFYTFQTLSYTIDVYRGRVEPTRHPLDFALFVAFFPQLVAGPIERAGRLLPQIRAPRRFHAARFGSGAWLVLWGLFKKAGIADNLAELVDAVYAPGAEPTSGEVVLATYAFTFQVYCDFSGYADIARGTARMLGFELSKNFDLPYFARSPADFWRRWHITLSSWLRDYVYIPLGGNRGGPRRVALNLFATMVLSGLWHGAAWHFVIWGAYHGAVLIAHRALQPTLARVAPAGGAAGAVWTGLGVGLTFHLFAFGLLMFRADSMAQVATLLGAVFGNAGAGLAGAWLAPFALLVAPLLVVQIGQLFWRDAEFVLRWPLPARALLYSALMAGLALFGSDGGRPFVYFQF